MDSLNTKPKRCFNCGEESISLENQKGKCFPFKGHDSICLSVDLFMNECLSCGEIPMRKKDIRALDEALEVSLAASTRKMIDYVTHGLNVSQKNLAQCLGVSKQHVSYLKHSSRLPSSTIYNFLEVLSRSKDAFQILGQEINRFGLDWKFSTQEHLPIEAHKTLEAKVAVGTKIEKFNAFYLYNLSSVEYCNPDNIEEDDDFDIAVGWT